MRFNTIFTSNIPVDCYVIKGRLVTEGVDCFVFDENIVWVHPFKAVAVGGVKLKVPSDKYNIAKEIISNDKDWTKLLNEEYKRQNEIFRLRKSIRESRLLDENFVKFETEILSSEEIEDIIIKEDEMKALSDRKFVFTWKQFWYELFDPDGNVFKYLRVRPNEYYLEEDLFENFISNPPSKPETHCPECNSENVKYGYAIDYKLDILYLLLSLLIFGPFPPLRKNFYCYNCGVSFKRKRAAANNGYTP